MLNEDGNENGIKINRSNKQKKIKTNLHVQDAFCLSLPLFCATVTLFCRIKTSNVLVTHYFYGGTHGAPLRALRLFQQQQHRTMF